MVICDEFFALWRYSYQTTISINSVLLPVGRRGLAVEKKSSSIAGVYERPAATLYINFIFVGC